MPTEVYLIAILVLVLVFILLGVRKVPIGAVGVLISFGRRTGVARGEGATWVIPGCQRLEYIFLRERQVDIPQANYYTADRARIGFKTTARVSVSDAVSLFNQGPGTYAPFTREGVGGAAAGSEEANVALRKLIENSIRESVQSMSIQDVMFGGGPPVPELIRDRLRATCKRWGLKVVDVWLTDVDTESAELKSAVQSQIQAEMDGRGELTGHEYEVKKGAMMIKVAAEMAQQIEQTTGQQVDINELQQFLAARYHDEKALDVALASAGQPGIMGAFYLQHFGVPLPQPGANLPPNLGPAAGGQLAPPGASCPSCGHANEPGSAFCEECGTKVGQAALPPAGGCPDGRWTVGREGNIQIDGDGVSRVHLAFESRAGQLTVTDMGSANGTTVGGRRLQPNAPTMVSPSDTIHLGRTAQVTVRVLIQAASRARA